MAYYGQLSDWPFLYILSCRACNIYCNGAFLLIFVYVVDIIKPFLQNSFLKFLQYLQQQLLQQQKEFMNYAH